MNKQHFVNLFFCFLLSSSLLTATSSSEILDGLQVTTDVAKDVTGSIVNATKSMKKDWTIVVYMAADNDLRGFAARNIKQMTEIGSNQHLNLCAHLDIRLRGNQKVTRRYIIQKDKVIHANANDPLSQKMDSGCEKTLINACKWAFETFPAKNYGLIFWNHGTGINDPLSGRIINVSDLFYFDPTINKFELDRSIGFFDYIGEPRGVCWDDSTGHYLSNQKLEEALSVITKEILNNKKLALIGFDACLMSMLEVANIVKEYADILVSSQEVELGTGWDYSQLLSPFLYSSVSSQALAEQIVAAYQQTYRRITNDYTLSAVDLSRINPIEQNVEQVAATLLDAIAEQKSNSVIKTLKASRNKRVCTHFDEPNYIDLHHFYQNLLRNMHHFQLRNPQQTKEFTTRLTHLLHEGMYAITDAVFANVIGKNLRLAKGISIYFPERKIHASYLQTRFAKQSSWLRLLRSYIQS